MANNSNQVELVVTVEVDKANRSIKSVNTSLAGIEAAATKAARGASQGIDGMTASMVKGATAGNLLADAIKKAIDFAKEWTIEAAKEAAHTERAASVARGLAKAHGDSAQAAQEAIVAIREVGYSTQEATTSVQKLIISDIGLEKAKGIAKIAKDAAAMSTEGDSAAQAFEKIMLAIETGQSRGLRTLSMFPDLARAEQVARLQAELHGKTLDDNQVKMVRWQAIVQASVPIQGAAAAAADTYDGQMKKLSREMKDLKDDVGRAFQGELLAVVGILKSMVGFFGEHTDAIEKFGKGILALVGIMAAITAATKAWAMAQGALNLAMSVNPAFLLAGGIIGAGAVIWKQYSDMKEGWDKKIQEQKNRALRSDVLAGRTSMGDLKKRGMNPDQIRDLISGRKGIEGGEPGFEMEGLPKVRRSGEPNPEDLKLALEVQKRQRENTKYFREQAIATRPSTILVNNKPMEVPVSGFAKDVADINKELVSRATWVDDKGEHHVPLTKAAWAAVIEFASNKLGAFLKQAADHNKQATAEYLKGQEEVHHWQMAKEAQRFEDRLKHDAEIADKALDPLRDVYAFEEQRAGFERDARLRQVEGQDAVTLQQKVAVEAQKAQIEIEYLEKVHEVKQHLYDMDTSRMLMEEELTLQHLGYRADQISARIAELSQQREDIRQQADEANDDAVKAARENAANRQAQLVRDHNRTIFESLKQQAGGVFDALLQKSQSVWAAIGNSFKTAILTAIKEVVTSRVAAMLMQLFTGQKVGFAGGGAGPGGSGGVLGGLGGLLGVGAVPVFGSGVGGGGVVPGLAPGTTPPFIAGGSASAKAGAGGLLSLNTASLKNLASWKTLYSAMALGGGMMMLGGAQKGSAFGTVGGGAMMGAGIGLSGGPIGAVGGAGIGLYMDALRRGGWTGVGEATAGGALFGWNVGGPLGAAIGAGVGFLSGMVRLFVKGASEKLRDKIKALYGVSITDKGFLSQILQIIKQTYGGNIETGIRSQQVRELVELYAMSTGQNFKGNSAIVRSVDLSQSGGSLYQMQGYYGGQALPNLGGAIGGGSPSAAPASTTIVLNPQQTEELWRTGTTQAITQNPRAVAASNAKAQAGNFGRLDAAVLTLAPGTLIR